MNDKAALDYALHPKEDRRYSVAEYLAEFEQYDAALRPQPRCPICGANLYINQLRDRAHTRQFAHIAGTEIHCPLVNDDCFNRVFVSRRLADPILEARQRDAFMQQWRGHFQTMRRQAPSLSVVRLIRIIEYADVLHLWACPNLMQADLPYILLVLAEFIAETPGAAHPSWLRFCFDSSVTELTELRRPGRPAPRFYRFHYRPSHNSMFPSARHLLGWQEVAMSDIHLSEESMSLTHTDALAFETFIRQSTANVDQLTQ